MKKVKVGIVGGSGYTGMNYFVSWAQHPHAEIVTITGRKDAERMSPKCFHHLEDAWIWFLKILLPHLWINVMSYSLQRRTA